MKLTQKQKILEYMVRHKEGISSMDAIRMFGCTRLSARIADLKAEGYRIKSAHKTNPETKQAYKVYFMEV